MWETALRAPRVEEKEEVQVLEQTSPLSPWGDRVGAAPHCSPAVGWPLPAAIRPPSGSLVPSPQQDKRRKYDGKAYGSRWRQGDGLAFTVTGKTDATLWKNNLIYRQWKQASIVRNKDKLKHLSPLLSRLSFSPLFPTPLSPTPPAAQTAVVRPSQLFSAAPHALPLLRRGSSPWGTGLRELLWSGSLQWPPFWRQACCAPCT